MVRINQHGRAGELFDVNRFLLDLDRFLQFERWEIRVEQCLGAESSHIEQASSSGLSLSDAAFRDLYRGIYQTIDGQFLGFAAGKQLFELRAVDSSYWEIIGPQEFETHMVATYGAWAPSWSRP